MLAFPVMDEMLAFPVMDEMLAFPVMMKECLRYLYIYKVKLVCDVTCARMAPPLFS
jgi:hypothetical protein